jgi:hypothetical protein
MAKATIATMKSFLKNNKNVMFRLESRMSDGLVEFREEAFKPLEGGFNPDDKHRFGFKRIWFTPSGNVITPYHAEGMRGFYVYNLCGSFFVAVKDP